MILVPWHLLTLCTPGVVPIADQRSPALLTCMVMLGGETSSAPKVTCWPMPFWMM